MSEIEKVSVRLGDCLEVLATLPENSVDSVVTDPPYELGFMGKSWDASGVAFSPDTWRQVMRVLKPGGHMVAFGAPKNYHRLACAIEDAGFEIRDSLMWVFGTGFPKSMNVSKAIDKSADEAKQWAGWGTALKPAYEPIVLARKPLSEKTVAANVLRWGTGAVNVDACRIAAPDGVPKFNHRGEPSQNCYGDGRNGSNRTGEIDASTGRWPANLCHDGSEEVLELFPKDAGRFFYSAKANKSDRAGSKHPTVKPVALMQWLVRMVTPPGGTVLDPFAGSGTTGQAAINESFPAILIEREQEYHDDIIRRLTAASSLKNLLPTL